MVKDKYYAVQSAVYIHLLLYSGSFFMNLTAMTHCLVHKFGICYRADSCVWVWLASSPWQHWLTLKGNVVLDPFAMPWETKPDYSETKGTKTKESLMFLCLSKFQDSVSMKMLKWIIHKLNILNFCTEWDRDITGQLVSFGGAGRWILLTLDRTRCFPPFLFKLS